MNSFRQLCPSCRSSLELPVEANGKTAICPACQNQFVAAVPPSAESESESDRQQATGASERSPRQAVRKSYRCVSIERIFDDSRCVFVDRRRPLLLPFLLPSLLVLLGFVYPLVYLNEMAATNAPRALQWAAALTPWFVLVTVYTFWFALNLAREVCDAEPDAPANTGSRIRLWFLPRGREFVALLIAVTSWLLFCAAIIALAVIVVKAGGGVKAIEIRLLTMIGAFLGAGVVLTAVAMRFWPVIPLAMDGRTGSGVIGESLAMTNVNRMPSFFLVVAAFVLIGGGFALFGLGLPLALPWVALVFIVALRLIDARRIPALDRGES